jgi:hypothetical protein
MDLIRRTDVGPMANGLGRRTKDKDLVSKFNDLGRRIQDLG